MARRSSQAGVALRISTVTNPLGLRLGDEVRVRRIAYVEYDVNDNKCLSHSDAVTPFRCTVVGIVKRAVGKYVPSRRYSSFDGPDTDESARLELAYYVRLYECKTRLEDKAFLVHPDDIEVLDQSSD